MKILITLFFFSTFLNIKADNNLFNQANNLYAKEEYKAAQEIYEEIIQSGILSPEVYYNLGNCYYKKNDWANAIWCYEKSIQIKKQEKTVYNLNLAKLNIIDKIDLLPKIFYKKWWNNLTQLLTIKNWQILTLLSIWIMFLYHLIINKRRLNYKIKILIIFPILLFFISLSAYYKNNQEEAIIMNSNIILTSAPSNNSTNLFSIHSGTKIEIIDEIGEWINIRIANGNTGWMKRDGCKSLKKEVLI